MNLPVGSNESSPVHLPADSTNAAAYNAAISWIESFIRPLTGTGPQRTPAGWASDGPARLARIDGLLQLIGHPERRYATIHVTGTSGKGSICTYIGNVLWRAGLTTGVHTTPYLQAPVEKLQVNGRFASTAEVVDLVRAFRTRAGIEGRGDLDLPYPALWLALTYLYFARRPVDIAVIEVSSGGRYDWTNTLTPEVAVISTVGPDHLQTLGPTLADVAFHKAGIIKRGRPAVTGVQPPELAVIEEEAQLSCSSLRRLGHEFEYRVRACTDAGVELDFRAGERVLAGVQAGMLGRHQAFNAALALAALDAYGERRGPLPEEAMREGLRTAHLAGRLELIQRRPDVVLDGAHNPEKAAALAAAVEEIFPERSLLLVVGALSTKDVHGILAPFAGRVRRAYVTLPHVLGKSSLDPEVMARSVAELGIPVTIEPDPLQATRAAMDQATPQDLVCVTGSLYLVGEVRRLWVSDEQVIETGLSAVPAGPTGS